MLKLVKGTVIFLMLVGMVTTAFAEFETNQDDFVLEVVKVDVTETAEMRNDENVQMLVMKHESVAEATAPILLNAEVVVTDPLPSETLPQENSEIFEEVEVETETEKPTEAEKKNAYHTGYLTARKGYITDSPCGPNGNDGYETWYPPHPGGAVKILERECGFTNLKLEVCREEGPRNGVRIISGTMPNGETFENLVVVAADIVCKQNPTGVFRRGDLIETSLGPGIIVDFCERAVNERKYNGRTHIDIATSWYT